MDRDTFVFRREWRDAISGLPKEVRLEIYEAIIEYGTTGKLPDLKPMAMLAFNFAKTVLDKDSRRYEEICQKRSEAGKKGGALKGNRNAAKQAKQANANKTNKTSYNDNDYDNNHDIIISSSLHSEDNIILSSSSLHSEEDASHVKNDATRHNGFREKVVSYFNDRVKGKSIKRIEKISEGTHRAEWLAARRREYGDDAIFRMIDKAAESEFLNGHNQRGFVASFDWLIRPNNFPKVLEGNYDDINENRYGDNRQDNSAVRRAEDAASIVARLAAEDDARARI